jgi:hypothetical protein
LFRANELPLDTALTYIKAEDAESTELPLDPALTYTKAEDAESTCCSNVVTEKLLHSIPRAFSCVEEVRCSSGQANLREEIQRRQSSIARLLDRRNQRIPIRVEAA